MIEPEVIEEMERNCFIITNSYVYSLFIVAAGSLMIGYWYIKHRR